MAENETLDLWSRHSGRWRQLLRKIEDDEPVEGIADEAARCLYKTAKNLVELLPVAEFLAVAAIGNGELHELVRRCRKGRDYAELFEQVAALHADPDRLVEGVLVATTDRFFDQIQIEILGSEHWPDIMRFRLLREEVKALMQDDVTRLAKRVANHPTEKPRMPARSAERKEREQQDLLRLPLQVRRSGTHG